MRFKNLLASTLLALGAAHAGAATAPGLINYQGVLRDASGDPLDGPRDMTFSFFDAETAGNEILVDAHLGSAGKAVIASGGLFSVALGSGDLSDGAGPGTYTTLAEMFAQHGTVYLEVRIGAETLAPRVRVLASAYAQNAARLQGRAAAEFVDTSSSQQFKTGSVVVGAMTPLWGAVGVQGQAPEGGGYFRDADGSGFSLVGFGDYGIYSSGGVLGGQFLDADGTSSAQVASGVYGIFAQGAFTGGYFRDMDDSGSASVGFAHYGISAGGNSMGGFFTDTDGNGYANVGVGFRGIEGFGGEAGGYFKDADGSGYAFVGFGESGIEARGLQMGGHFKDLDGSGFSYVGIADRGIESYGNEMGGYFKDADGSGFAHVGWGDYGILAYGNEVGGFFRDADNSGYANVGWGDYGIQGFGNAMGGYFKDLDASGQAYAGRGDRGIEAYGSEMGGYFKDLNGAGEALVGYSNVGIEARGSSLGGYFRTTDFSAIAALGDALGYGINARGDTAGGVFLDQNGTGYALVAYGNRGIEARGTEMGGNFTDTNGSGIANVAVGDYGITAYGDLAGGFFDDLDAASYAFVGSGAYKILGSGTVSFVQNHPDSAGEVIVYHAPEASEVAVYTRGRGRLENGAAVVALDPTFAWVANPDLGLTAHLTPRGPCPGLHVESVSTEALAVRCDDAGGEDLAFDFIVYGLRLGFEEMAPVQKKDREAYIPSMSSQRELYAASPELRRYNALERFKRMEAARGGAAAPDLSRSRDLVARIGEYDPAIHGDRRPHPEDEASAMKSEGPASEAAPPGGAGTSLLDAPGARPSPTSGPPASVSGWAPDAAGPEESHPGAIWLPVSETVESGDVLALDPDSPGSLRRSSYPADPKVVGVALGDPRDAAAGPGLEAPVAVSGIALVWADATPAEIRPGDLLETSGTPGHAARAAGMAPGAILGKALDPLAAGTGMIRVLLQR